ncbi:hypothetical protein AVEN_212921-1 [Araneus ventricosus]|uniref:Uncharacterized protein n=1 Tax=Araneus ventricosus TaxID=182803 RepID=A0A4Y2MJK5_ARAVE|nr:hypothetical protein AVEN_212921-1 [Araneus ventricosus]
MPSVNEEKLKNYEDGLKKLHFEFERRFQDFSAIQTELDNFTMPFNVNCESLRKKITLFGNIRIVEDTRARNLGVAIIITVDTTLVLQGGSIMTRTDLFVNKPHCAEAMRPSEGGATTSNLRLEAVQYCLRVIRMMREEKVRRSVKQRTEVKFLAAENALTSEIHHRL